MDIRGRLSRRSGGAILHFSHPPIPDVIRFGGLDWRAKREFHVTLLGSTTLLAPAEGAPVLDNAIRHAARKLPFAITLCRELWQIRENDVRTIIRMCDVSGSEEFFARIENELNLAIERPPYHVTLYTIGSLRGIGLASQADLKQMGTEIEGAERDTLLSVLQ